MNKLLCFLWAFAFLAAQGSYCQSKRAVNWYFGKGAALNFDHCEPVALTDCSIYEVNSTATMSDEEGNLLYYINSQQVTNRNHQVMSNGDGIDFYNWNISQSIISIPLPGSSNRYIAFTVGDEKHAKLLYHEIDMSDGLGRVVIKNKQIFSPEVTMRMTAVNHSNGKDVWLMVQGLGIGKYYAFLITQDGVAQEPVVSDFNIVDVDIYEYGPMKFSPDGSMMVSADAEDRSYSLLFYRFNNATGKLSDPINQPLGWQTPHGIEFAPNNQLVYVSTRSGACLPGKSFLYQYSVRDWDKVVSQPPLMVSSSNENYGFLQLAINGKIYMGGRTSGCDENSFIHVINFPNEIGANCDFRENEISLGGNFIWNGLCNFNQSYFEGISPQLPTSLIFCPNDTVLISPGEFVSYQWSTGQNSDEIAVFKEGFYSVEVENLFGCVFSDTTFAEVRKAPSTQLSNTVYTCPGDTIVITPGTFKSYFWNTGETGAQIEVFKEGGYFVEFVDVNNCTFMDSTFLEFYLQPELQINDIYITEADTIEVDPGLFHSYLWSSGSTRATLEIMADSLHLGENEYSVEVQNQYGCYSRQDFTVHVTAAQRSLCEELILDIGTSELSVTNKSGRFKNHQIILFTLDGSVCFQREIPPNSIVDIPLSWKGYVIIMLKSDEGYCTRKMYFKP